MRRQIAIACLLAMAAAFDVGALGDLGGLLGYRNLAPAVAHASGRRRPAARPPVRRSSRMHTPARRNASARMPVVRGSVPLRPIAGLNPSPRLAPEPQFPLDGYAVSRQPAPSSEPPRVRTEPAPAASALAAPEPAAASPPPPPTVPRARPSQIELSNTQTLLRRTAELWRQRGTLAVRPSREIFLDRIGNVSISKESQEKIETAIRLAGVSRRGEDPRAAWSKVVQTCRDDLNAQINQMHLDLARRWWGRNDLSQLSPADQAAIRRDGGLDQHMAKLRDQLAKVLLPAVEAANQEVVEARAEANLAGAKR